MIDFDNQHKYPFKTEDIDLIGKIFEAFKEKFQIPKTKSIEVSVLNEEEIREINRDYRGKDKVTDILSFSFMEKDGVDVDLMGVLYICYQEIEKFSSKDFQFNLSFLFVHGLLHVIGYDHGEEMSRFEEEMIGAFFNF